MLCLNNNISFMNLTKRQLNCLNGCLKKFNSANIEKYPYLPFLSQKNMGILEYIFIITGYRKII